MILFLFEWQIQNVYLVNITSYLFETSVLSYRQLKEREKRQLTFIEYRLCTMH